MMDLAYAAKLEMAAKAPDDCFPDLLFEPLTNDFNDLYFKIDISDYGKEAISVDPRFTTMNILRIRGSTNRIDRYLEWTALYDDYMDYIVGKYGSLEMAQELDDAGMLEDVLPTINHRPILKKGKLRRLFKKGIVPSFMPYGVDANDCYHYIREICEQEELPTGEEEPDIDWAMRHPVAKKDRAMLQRNAERYRRAHRLEILAGGTSVAGISSNMDFVDNYYASMRKGLYDTEFSEGSGSESSLVAQMKNMTDKDYRHEGQIWADEDASSGSRYYYDSTMIRDRQKAERYEILKHLQQFTGIDLMTTMTSRGMSKKEIKAVRVGLEAVGESLALTPKQQKKLKKKQAKLDNAESKSKRADEKLQEVLLNNKIFLNGGTVRFEDMMRRGDYDDDY